MDAKPIDIAEKPQPDASFAARLIRLRNKAKLNQAEAAASAGLDLSLWKDFENGMRTPLIAGLWPIARALKVNVGDLLA